MSSRGQVVIPKFLREAAGMMEGDEIEVVLDGQRLILAASGGGQAELSPGKAGGDAQVAEAGFEYTISRATVAHRLEDGQRPSKVWADRIQALAALKRLRVELPAVNLGDLLAESRRELEGRGSKPKGGGARG